MKHLARSATKCSRLMEFARSNRQPPPAFSISPKLFSTEASNSGLDSSNDLFFQAPPNRVVYGRLTNITKHTTKSDVVHYLEYDLHPASLKVEYNRFYHPQSMMVEFPSPSAYDAALRAISRKARLLSLSRADKSEWDVITPYDGKVLLLHGIPRNALVDDVERFLSGCQYDSSSIQMFLRPADEGTIRVALVRFPSKTHAMHAYITKNRGFCLNNQITLQVLH